MIGLRTCKTMILVAAAACSTGARALDAGGNLALSYDRVDYWAGGLHSDVPTLRLTGNASASDYVVSPGLLGWRAGVTAERLRSQSAGTESGYDFLGYGLDLGIFQSHTSPLRLSASASRVSVDMSTKGADGSAATGVLKTDTLSAGGQLNLSVLPPLRLSYSRRETIDEGLGRARSTETSSEWTAGTRFAPGPFDSSLDYRALFNRGDRPGADFDYHQLDLRAGSSLGYELALASTATYRLVQPIVFDAYGPKQETTGAALSLTWGRSTTSTALTYGYNHAIFTDAGAAPREFLANSVGLGATRPVGENWQGTLGLSASSSQSRADGIENVALGQGLSALARWTSRPRTADRFETANGTQVFGLDFGAQLGLVEPQGGAVSGGWGLSASGRWLAGEGPTTYNALYAVSYGTNLDARQGWTLTQGLRGQLNRRLDRDFSLQATLQADAVRQEAAVFGGTASRSIRLGAGIAWRSITVQADVGTSDGLSGPLKDAAYTDALIIPAKYDTHTRYASVVVGGLRLAGVTATATARIVANENPGIPAQYEASFDAQLGYALGLFSLSLGDRYVAGGPNGFDFRTNYLFARISRSFGGRW